MDKSTQVTQNSFSEGLVMDFSPEFTKNNSLTSALNATLVTFNGNEFALLNDMGNGRVETARLPLGYVPVGSCEFGDIIYIISYNPITNKSLIGCFPSPERIVASKEISEITLNIRWEDFLEVSNNEPSGKIKNMSIKKILFNRNLNPNDLYVVSTSDALRDSYDTLSDLGNTDHMHGSFPKLLKIHIVSIEDSGKIVFLDSSTRWYSSKGPYKDNLTIYYDYYIHNKLNSSTSINDDLDAYRSVVQSAYSVFLSKVSGKLALLLELETINSFSCTYSVSLNIIKNPSLSDNFEYKDNTIYAHFSWGTDHGDINPSGIIVTDSKWLDNGGKIKTYQLVGDNYILTEAKEAWKLPLTSAVLNKGYNLEKCFPITRCYEVEKPSIGDPYKYYKNKSYYLAIKELTTYTHIVNKKNGNLYEIGKYLVDNKEITLNDDIVNNYFHKDVIKALNTSPFTIPTRQKIKSKWINTDLSNLVWNFSIAPAMPYGVLEHLQTNHTLDFSKLNTGTIEMPGWRYYNLGTNSTITLDLETYPEEGKGISEVVLEFYDTSGLAAAYHIANKISYSGTFNEIIELNIPSKNYKQNNIDSLGNNIIHPGKETNADTEGAIKIGEKYYENDAGTIYANMLYMVKVVVKYSNINSQGNYDSDTSQYKYFYHWYYTFGLFNDEYYHIKNFDNLSPNLILDADSKFTQKDEHLVKYANYHISPEVNGDTKPYLTLGANVIHVNQDKKANIGGNINMQIGSRLLEDYNVFNLVSDQENNNLYSNILVNIKSGKDNINVSNYLQESEEEISTFKELDPQIGEGGFINKALIGKDLGVSLGFKAEDCTGVEIYDSADAYNNYKDLCSVTFAETANPTLVNESLTYTPESGTPITVTNYLQVTENADHMANTGINLTMSGVFYNKFLNAGITRISDIKLVKSIINLNPLKSYGMYLNNGHLYFNNLTTICMGESDDHSSRWGSKDFMITSSNTGWKGVEVSSFHRDAHDDWHPPLIHEEIQPMFLGVADYLSPIAICRDTSSHARISAVKTSRNCYNSLTLYYPPKERPDNDKLYLKPDLVPYYNLEDTKDKPILSFLGFRDSETGNVYLTNDPFYSSVTNLAHRGENGYGVTTSTTLADLLGAIYAQLYSVIDDTTSRWMPTKFTYLSPFVETWSKDFIVHLQAPDDFQTVSKMLAIHTIPVDIYTKSILGYLKQDISLDINGLPKDEELLKNISFKLVPSTKVVTFKCGIKYDILHIKDLKDNENKQDLVKVIAYENNQPKVSYVSGVVYNDALYTINNGNIRPFSTDSIMFDVQQWNGTDQQLFMVPNYNSTMTADMRSLSDMFYVDRGYLHIHNFNKTLGFNNKFFIEWSGESSDNPRITGFAGTSIFNKFKI